MFNLKQNGDTVYQVMSSLTDFVVNLPLGIPIKGVA